MYVVGSEQTYIQSGKFFVMKVRRTASSYIGRPLHLGQFLRPLQNFLIPIDAPKDRLRAPTNPNPTVKTTQIKIEVSATASMAILFLTGWDL
jgi:hypothetical protein